MKNHTADCFAEQARRHPESTDPFDCACPPRDEPAPIATAAAPPAELPAHWKPRLGRMMQIDGLIDELQTIHRQFGNTCVYVTGLCWGAVALNRHAHDERFMPDQAFDKNGERRKVVEAAIEGDLHPDVVALVNAARRVAFTDPSDEAIRALDQASEAFASRVPWDDEPEEESDFDRTFDDGVVGD